jgi:hypothetical protein
MTTLAMTLRLLFTLVLFEALLLLLGPDHHAARDAIATATTAHLVPPWEADTDLGIHLAAVINLVLLILLAATSKLWTRPLEAPASDDPPRPAKPRYYPLVITAAIAILAGFYAVSSFASKSLWWDEIWQMKQASHGSWKADKKDPDQLKFVPTTWKRCAFYYQKPTNHAPMALAQKASLGLWRSLTGHTASDISELAARAPALIASAIAVLLLFRVIGFGGGATLMAVMLLLHPWHLRYGVEARAYALIVPFTLSAILAARRLAVNHGRGAGNWAWLAANQAAWIWAYPNAVFEVSAFFITLGVLLWRTAEAPRDRWTSLIRLSVAHLCAGMVWLQLFLPNLMQARHWAGQEAQSHYLDAGLARDTLSSLTYGMEWAPPPATVEAEGLTSLVAICGGSPTVAAFALLLALGLSGFGLLRTALLRPRLGALLLCPVIGCLAYVAVGRALDLYFYPRFLISLLPVFIAGLGLAVPGFTDWAQRYRYIGLAMLLPFFLVTQPQRTLLKTRPYAPLRDVAEFVQGWNPAKPPVTLCYGLGREAMPFYAPTMLASDKVADLIAARAKAKAEGRDFLVVQGYSSFNRQLLPEAFALLDDPQQFTEVRAYPGIQADFYFRVFLAK